MLLFQPNGCDAIWKGYNIEPTRKYYSIDYFASNMITGFCIKYLYRTHVILRCKI